MRIARVNLLGALYAFEFARKCVPVLHRFVLISSDAVLSAPPLGGPSHCRPATPAVASYALSKLAAEAQVCHLAVYYIPLLNPVHMPRGRDPTSPPPRADVSLLMGPRFHYRFATGPLCIRR